MSMDLKIKQVNDKLLTVIKESELPVTVLEYMIRDLASFLNASKQMALEKASKEVKKDGI